MIPGGPRKPPWARGCRMLGHGSRRWRQGEKEGEILKPLLAVAKCPCSPCCLLGARSAPSCPLVVKQSCVCLWPMSVQQKPHLRPKQLTAGVRTVKAPSLSTMTVFRIQAVGSTGFSGGCQGTEPWLPTSGEPPAYPLRPGRIE